MIVIINNLIIIIVSIFIISSSNNIITRIEGGMMIDSVVDIIEMAIGMIMMVVIGGITVTSISVLLLQEIMTENIEVVGEGTKPRTRNSTIMNIMYYLHIKMWSVKSITKRMESVHVSSWDTLGISYDTMHESIAPRRPGLL